jgi:putative salt-induced outer membrane protein YdiY
VAAAERLRFPVLPALLLCLPLAAAASALSVVSLDSGEQVRGTVLEASDAKTVVLQSELLGRLSLPRERVVSITPAQPAAAGHKEPTPEAAKAKPAAVPAAKKPAAPQQQAAAKTAPEKKDEEEFRWFDFIDIPEFPESWRGNVRFGVNASTGDTKWTETNIRGRLDIPKNQRLYRIEGSYVYRQNERPDGSTFKSIDRYDAAFTYRYNFENDFFVQNSLAARADQRKQIDLEAQETVGVGYTYKRGTNLELTVGAGGGVEYYEVANREPQDDVLTVLSFFQEFTWRPWERASVVQSFNFFANPEDSADYNYVWSSALRFRFNHSLGFELAYDRNFDNDIGPGEVEDDSRWRNALIVYF